MKIVALTLSLLALPTTNVLAQAEGKQLYATCAACHQADGKGIPNAFPPLAGSEWVNGPAENLIRIQLRGLQGPITVKGAQYNSVMPPQAQQSDAEIAAVLTYVRSNFGNDASPVTPDQVKALREEVGKGMLREEDLIDPNKVEVTPDADGKVELKSAKVDEIEHKASVNMTIVIGVLLWLGICAAIGFTGVGRGK